MTPRPAARKGAAARVVDPPVAPFYGTGGPRAPRFAMRYVVAGLLVVVAAAGCDKLRRIGTNATPTEFQAATLAEARKGFTTKLPAARAADRDPPDVPPRGV